MDALDLDRSSKKWLGSCCVNKFNKRLYLVRYKIKIIRIIRHVNIVLVIQISSLDGLYKKKQRSGFEE